MKRASPIPAWQKITGNEVRSFLLVFLILIVLISAIMSTHYVTNSTIANLQQNTLEAANTFRMNGLLQDVVNQTNQVDLALRKRMLRPHQQNNLLMLKDSVLHVKKTLQRLQTAIMATPKKDHAQQQLLQLMHERSVYLDTLLQQLEKPGRKAVSAVAMTPIEKQLNDSIYYYALRMQTMLELNLSATLSKGNNLSQRISLLSRILSVIAVIAFAALGTLLIRRLLQHDKLIRELRQSKLELENLARVKEEFLANMSHEIRTPLHAIKGYADLLKRSDLNARQHRQVNVMGHAVELLLNVVNDILDFSKLEEGRLRIEKRPVNLAELCKQVYPMFYQAAADKGLSWNVDVDPALPDTVMGDAVRVKQVLFNLVGNAIKFTDHGYVQLKVRLLPSVGPNHQVYFEVKDSGIGIDEAYHQLIFNRFEQAPQQLRQSNSIEGTGLGLSIVQGLVMLMNGQISLESEAGKGAIFKLTIPFDAAAPIQEGELNENETVADEQWLSNARILVAEDNEINQLLLQYLFEEWKIAWHLAEHGGDVIDRLTEGEQYDLILMDIRMPVMNGSEALRVIREQLKLQMPVIALTANTQLSGNKDLLEDGFTDCLPKPFEQQQLLTLLQKHLPNKINGNALPSNTDVWPLSSGLPVEVVQKVIPIFLQHFPAMLQQLEAAMETEDCITAAALAHKMSGTLAAIGTESAAGFQLLQLRSLLAEQGCLADAMAVFMQFKQLALEDIDRCEKYMQSALN
ncbi:ATP-binding protein [Phnomibacter ginsenosidimutans]|uniref:histidine kinase n=1 Tax=Phnomibacter ginsenosidimutans TaxID=2676868 RepID=A0A6I6GF86_9BACT|nr:ATP-binding protein [Phnomibacter ginsenosidimutans]QGW29090.1 response regulator [Phnomibacter ginsenosidimutans]